MLLRQLSYAIKNQLKAPKTPYWGLWDEMPPTRGISCLSLVLYGMRIGSEHNQGLERKQRERDDHLTSVNPGRLAGQEETQTGARSDNLKYQK